MLAARGYGAVRISFAREHRVSYADRRPRPTHPGTILMTRHTPPARCWLALSLVLGFAGLARAHAPADAMIDKYLARATDRISQRFLDDATTLEDGQNKRPSLREQSLDI